VQIHLRRVDHALRVVSEPQILIVSCMILLSSGRHFNPEQQLRFGDDGNVDGVNWNLLKLTQNRIMRGVAWCGTILALR
jgi:hypothetical protein